MATGVHHRELEHGAGQVRALAFSPGSSLLAISVGEYIMSSVYVCSISIHRAWQRTDKQGLRRELLVLNPSVHDLISGRTRASSTLDQRHPRCWRTRPSRTHPGSQPTAFGTPVASNVGSHAPNQQIWLTNRDGSSRLLLPATATSPTLVHSCCRRSLC